MDADDVIEIRQGKPPWWHLLAGLLLLGIGGWILQGPDERERRFGGLLTVHELAMVLIVMMVVAVGVWIWRWHDPDRIAVRIDAAGIRERTRVAPARFIAWSEVTKVEVTRVGLLQVVRIRRRGRKPCVFGPLVEDAQACVDAIDAGRLRWQSATT